MHLAYLLRAAGTSPDWWQVAQRCLDARYHPNRAALTSLPLSLRLAPYFDWRLDRNGTRPMRTGAISTTC